MAKKTSLPPSHSKNLHIPSFDKRANLTQLLNTEKSFKLQVFSVESVEIFEQFLHSENIQFSKGFTSKPPPKSKLALLLDDGSSIPSYPRIILFSNRRNFSFVPYCFQLSQREKESAVGRKLLLGASKDASLISLLSTDLQIVQFTAGALNYVQSVIILCMLKETKFKRICAEARQVDPELNNGFVILCELNWLSRRRFCTRSGDSYKLDISHEIAMKICENLGFLNIFS